MQKEIRELYEDFRQKEGVSRFAMQTFTEEVFEIINNEDFNRESRQKLIRLFSEFSMSTNEVTEYSVNNLLDRTMRLLQQREQSQMPQEQTNPKAVTDIEKVEEDTDNE